jgi:hypothetical protein
LTTMMDKEIGKWLVRGGGLAVLLGFFLPSLTVSCAAAPDLSQTVSLYDLSTSSRLNMQLLILIPLGALVTVFFAWIPESLKVKDIVLFLGQFVGTGLGLLSIPVTLLGLSSQLGQSGFQLTPAIGTLILTTGYILVGMGLFIQVSEVFFPALARQKPAATIRQQDYAYENPEINANIVYPAGNASPVNNYTGQSGFSAQAALQNSSAQAIPQGAYLRVIHGYLGQAYVPVSCDPFSIGRDSGNLLQLRDKSVSRQHACLRYAQGSWFIQDQQSSGGILVNGQSVRASRINPGDLIQIGDSTFEFNIQQ